MEIKLEETPSSGSYEFYADNEVHYTFHFKRLNKGHNLKIFKNRDMVSNTNAPWLLAPDYEAAKELIENYLKKNRIIDETKNNPIYSLPAFNDGICLLNQPPSGKFQPYYKS